MSAFIDRRSNGKNQQAVNRQRFIKRFTAQIKQAVSESIQERRITDIEQGEKIHISRKDIAEPQIKHGQGGERQFVLPGNKIFRTGDRLTRSSAKNAEDSGHNASDQGEGMDDFQFYLTKEEYLNIFFDDLALPNLVKTQLTALPNMETLRSGVSRTGAPPHLNILRSFRQALSRRLSFRHHHEEQIAALKKEKAKQLKQKPVDEAKIALLNQKLREAAANIKKIPFIDTVDLRFNAQVKRPTLTTQAVMFCIMDVSGSMDEQKKELAKRFFILLYLFLTKNYQKITLVFIRHHTTAKEVNERDFFYSQETGGTVVSSALSLTAHLIQDRFPVADWNIYVAQASDGDNWHADSPHCADILETEIMPWVQYYAYIEIMPRYHQSLWQAYLDIQLKYPQFAMKSIASAQEIYPVFHDLFKQRNR